MMNDEKDEVDDVDAHGDDDGGETSEGWSGLRWEGNIWKATRHPLNQPL